MMMMMMIADIISLPNSITQILHHHSAAAAAAVATDYSKEEVYLRNIRQNWEPTHNVTIWQRTTLTTDQTTCSSSRQHHHLTKNDIHNRSNHVFFIMSTSQSDKERHSQQIEPRVLHHVNITIWQRTTFTTDQTTCSSSATVRVDICSSRQTDVDSHSSWLLLATTLLTNYHSLMSSNYYRTWSLMSQGCSRWLWWKSGFHLVVTLTANVVIRPVLSLTALKF